MGTRKNSRFVWTDDRIAVLVEMSKRTPPLKLERVAKIFGCRRDSVDYKARALGLQFDDEKREMFWTPARYAEMEDLAAGGFSAEQIAQRIGGTRNQIIGKANRNNIKLQGGIAEASWRTEIICRLARAYPSATVEELSETTALEPRFVLSVLQDARFPRRPMEGFRQNVVRDMRAELMPKEIPCLIHH